jgi:hypothetical protein
MFPLLSVTELTVEVVSPHITATTFRFPEVCAAVNVIASDAPEVSVADFTCTKVGPLANNVVLARNRVAKTKTITLIIEKISLSYRG